MDKQVKQYPDWVDFVHEYGDPMVPHATDKQYDIHLSQESVPIIFVPGIMGTRLSNPSKKVIWNPDSAGSMIWNYGIRGPKTESDNLVGDKLHVVDVNNEDPGYVQKLANAIGSARDWDWVPRPPSPLGIVNPYGDGQEFAAMLKDWTMDVANLLVEHHWGEIAWDFYTDLLIQLSNPNILGSQDKDGNVSNPGYRKIFQCPVYVHGYNWLEDNTDAGQKLAAYIPQVIKEEKNQYNRLCNKVILITHSMGGLVTRSALQQFPSVASTQVLGVIHGAQPVNGAPVCYRRIRGGFEKEAGITGKIMGRSYEFVLPILGRCVGGMELLPNENYKDNNKNAQWLQGYDHDKLLTSRPNKSVYEDVYASTDPNDFFRLLFHPEGLTPGESASQDTSKDHLSDAVADFKAKLRDKAKPFTERLSPPNGTPYQHPNSYHMCANGKASFHDVRWRYARDGDATRIVRSRGEELNYPDPMTVGGGVDLNPGYRPEHHGAYFQIDDPDPLSGDGTVPFSSGSALFDLPGSRGLRVVGDVEHGTFYNDQGVRDSTEFFIRCLLEQHKKDRISGK